MYRILIAAMMALAITGCTTLQKVTEGTQANPITEEDVYTARSTYFISAGKAFELYRALPSCNKAPQPCRNGQLMLRIQKVDATVRRNLKALQAWVNGNRTISIASIQEALGLALAEANNIVKDYGLQSQRRVVLKEIRQ